MNHSDQPTATHQRVRHRLYSNANALATPIQDQGRLPGVLRSRSRLEELQHRIDKPFRIFDLGDMSDARHDVLARANDVVVK